MIEQLFGSKTRVKLLQLFLNNPNRAFYVREITRKIDEQINSVRRELANMLSIGIITSENNSSDNKLYYEINQQYEHYKPLKAIFSSKSVKAATKQEDEDDMIKRLRDLGAVKLMVLSGVFTRDEFAPVDVLIVGDVNKTKVNKFVQELEQSEGHELRFTSMYLDDFEYRVAVKDRFITDIMNAKKTVVLDETGLVSKKAK